MKNLSEQASPTSQTHEKPASLSRAHFIGVGGSGMAGIALIAHKRGINVSGSDLKESLYIQALLREGVPVVFNHNATNIDDPTIEVVVVSTAIPKSNPEYIAAQARGIPIWSRARMLAYLGEGFLTLAVAGTHGKTTTSSLLATSLTYLKADPTFLIGGVVDGFDASAHLGFGPYYVIEADESDGSFVEFNPHLAIITNIEADHLDHFEGIEEIHSSFSSFLEKVDDNGLVIACADSPDLVELVQASGKPFITYGAHENADVRFEVKGVMDFEVIYPDGMVQPFALGATPGVHNMLNSTAVAAALDWLGFNRQAAALAVGTFGGVRRRFERIGTAAGVLVVDDYGHHPTEVAATLQAVVSLGFSHVHVLFQPHRYTRTVALMDEFASAFDAANTITLMDVYSAGETPIPGVSSAALMEAIIRHDPNASVRLITQREVIADAMVDLAEPGDIIITMGAGDVTLFAPQILALLQKKEALSLGDVLESLAS